MSKGRWSFLALVITALAGSSAAFAQTPEAFYKGKDVRMLISHPPGGGYDLYARFFARHLSQFLPGHPNVIPQNMPGAAGVAMARYIFTAAPQDGTVIGLGPGSTGTAALFGSEGAKFDARKFSWIGSMTSDVAVSLAWNTAPVKTAQDLFTTELITGGAGATDQSVMYPSAVNRVLGTKFKIIPGYGGTSELALALERGEVQGIGSMNYSSIIGNKADWLRDKKVNVLLQLSPKRIEALPDVPAVVELAKSDDDRAVLELIVAQSTMARAIFGPPNIPADRLAALRGAFDAMLKDPAFLEEAKKLQILINDPMTGDEVGKLVDKLHQARPDLIAKASDAISTKK
jgi:tripartite-type tricarboxylate transporter receptor subunit TctC